MRKMPLLLTMMLTGPALASPPKRELCSARPGLNSPTCTVEPGHFQIETGLLDFTREHDGGASIGTLSIADSILRIGVTGSSEAQIAWTPHVHVSVRDRMTGKIERENGGSDVTLGWSRNLLSGETGPSMAVTASVTLPVGHRSISAGTWGLAVALPISFDLSDRMHLNVTPEVDAAPDSDGDGRHTAYGAAAGLTFDLADALALNAEAAAFRDEDPSGHATQYIASTSLAWQQGRDLAFDVGAIVGLNHNAPRYELYVGITRRF